MCQHCNMRYGVRMQQRPRTQECPVCVQDDFETEILFPGCDLHWFCPRCIETIWDSSCERNVNFACPMCRHSHRQPWAVEAFG
mmetsp:Transcript_40880/g.98761  ORF Transcript_40880/g.98761 Transcript_40880/m.98761 type:complete len:83 (-) Transcript_40880:429-677(-)